MNADMVDPPTATTFCASIETASDSLSHLLSSDPTSPQVVNALESLSALKSHLSSTQKGRAALLDRIQASSRALSEVQKQQVQLDNDIIATKMKSGDILSRRDEVARDLIRAKKELKRIGEPVQITGSDLVKTQEGQLGVARGVQEVHVADIEGEHNVETVQAILDEEREKLRLAEMQLVKVADEINAIQKKKAEVQDKVKEAQEEW